MLLLSYAERCCYARDVDAGDVTLIFSPLMPLLRRHAA